MNVYNFLTFDDMQQYVPAKLGTENWLTVYEYIESPGQKIGYFCALTPPTNVDRCLNDTSWDLTIGSGSPGFVFYGDGASTYCRFGDDDPIEPFVFSRSFHGLKPSYLELSEEFRHYFNLYEDRKSGTFILLDDNGDDVEVVRITPSKVEIRAKYLKEYLAARGMVMLLFFEFDRWSAKAIEELGIEKSDNAVREADHAYVRWINPCDGWSTAEQQTYARMMGKKVIPGLKDYKPSLSGRDDRVYESFVIGVDNQGSEASHTCDEGQLANYFGKNPEAPHYLIPVFFRKAVLGKYYADSAKYQVQDGYVFCGAYWSLRMDNNHPDYVVVYLGDLGHLSHTEQLYWKSFNVVPDGGVSKVAFQRGILGQFTDPDEPALAFKLAYERFGKQWHDRFGWDLFKPLGADDKHHWHALHVPVGGNQKEFDDQVMALSKLLIERLNERELAKHIEIADGDKGITKFEKYLEAVGFAKDQLVTFLRNLNGLRTGPAHVKGKDYQRAAQHFDLEGKGLARSFSDILTEATVLLAQLQSLTSQEPEG
jgi:hypothetical protein